MITTAQAVMSLRPNVEWSMSGDDVEGITWHTEGVEPLTTKEVKAEIKRLEKEEANAEKNREDAKKSAISKLSSLGLNEEEIKAIIGIHE